MASSRFSDKLQSQLRSIREEQNKTDKNDAPAKASELIERTVPITLSPEEKIKKDIESDGMAIKKAPKKFIGPELCKIAVEQNGLALKYIIKTYPQYLSDSIIETAVRNNGLAIAFVPTYKITRELAQLAVSQKIEPRAFRNTGIENYPIGYIPVPPLDLQLATESVRHSPKSIRDVPLDFMTKPLMRQAVSEDSSALGYIPPKYRTRDLVKIAVSDDPRTIRFASQETLTKPLCMSAFQDDPLVLQWIPDKYKTVEMCVASIKASNPASPAERFSIDWIPKSLWNEQEIIDALIDKFGEKYLSEWNCGLFKKHAESLPKFVLSMHQVPHPHQTNTDIYLFKQEPIVIRDLSLNRSSTGVKVYYISDLHLEHQFASLFQKTKSNYSDLSDAIDYNITQMLSRLTWEDKTGYLLVGGDVSCYKDIFALFYTRLALQWRGTVISVLGNHEFFDDHPEGHAGGYISRPIEEIVTDYRERLRKIGSYKDLFLLQNDLLINDKNTDQHIILDEKMLLSSTEEGLRSLCARSSFLVLGGNGFSGMNDKFNAANGLYRSAVTSVEKDRELSKRFESVYEKLDRCVHNMQVIVLTHTPVSDWLSKELNPNWIYINGHTHCNSVVRKQDGTTILSDNQIGYTPRLWGLKAFICSGWYDPFRQKEDGIFQITLQEYDDFNRGRNINCKSYNIDESEEQIIAMKKNDIYMFVLRKSSCLYLLQGGKKSIKLNQEIRYYYQHMDQFVKKARESTDYYFRILQSISNEVKQLGGDGRQHGCIVDIGFNTHIMLNPTDGTITPYYAPDSRSPDHDSMYLYSGNLYALLKDHAASLCFRFLALRSGGYLPILGKRVGIISNSTNNLPAFTPKRISRKDAKEIYYISEKMSAIQYLDNNVIRIWNDKILSTDYSKLEIAE